MVADYQDYLGKIWQTEVGVFLSELIQKMLSPLKYGPLFVLCTRPLMSQHMDDKATISKLIDTLGVVSYMSVSSAMKASVPVNTTLCMLS